MTPEKKYNNIKLWIGFTETIISIGFLAYLSFSPFSGTLRDFAFSVSANQYLALIIYVLTIGFISGLILFPFGFYKDFIMEKQYKLSNQTFFAYLIDKTKGMLLTLLIGIPILLILYVLLQNFQDEWWIIAVGILFLFTVVLAALAPILIFPLFYKFTRIEDEELQDKLDELTSKVDFWFDGIYSFNLSKTTKKANAGFTGLGRSRRIILSDTLIKEFTNEEIETVFAHELGHFKHKHIVKNIFLGLVFLLFTFFITNEIYSSVTLSMGLRDLFDFRALPLLFLILTIINLIVMPVSNYFSRSFEYEADKLAVDLTYKPDVFVRVLQKLSNINMADKEPNPIIEFLFYSHPSIKNRTDAIINKYGLRE